MDSLKKLEYLKGIYIMYIGHLNSVLGFFLVFSALTLNAMALMYRQGIGTGRCEDAIIPSVAFLMSFIFLFMDIRTRQITDDLELKLKALENQSFGFGETHFNAVPPAKHHVFRHRVLVRSVYVFIGGSFVSFAVFAALT